MQTREQKVRKLTLLCKAMEKSMQSLLQEQAKEWFKRFINEPWYDAAVQAYVETAQETGGILADHKKKVLAAINREDLFNQLADPGAGALVPVNNTPTVQATNVPPVAAAAVGSASGAKSKVKPQGITHYKTWEYLDERYNHVVVDDVRDVLVELEQEFQTKLEDFYQQKIADKLVPEASKELVKNLGMEFDFNKYDEVTRDYLKDKKIHWAKQVASETEKDIKAQLVKGYEAGSSSYDIAESIKQSTGFSMSRAEKIAQTEVMSSCNYAQYTASEINPDVVGHNWRSQNSSRTRSTHRAANKQYRPIGEPFDIGGAKLMFPGDGSLGAPAKEIISCRCWLEMVFADEIGFDVAETAAEKNAFTVNLRALNTKEYTDKYKSCGSNQKVNTRIRNEAIEMLKHRSGTENEDLVFLDARTGEIVIKKIDSEANRSVQLKEDEIKIIKTYSDNLITLHNHPSGSRPSMTDLLLMTKDERIEKLVVAGHDGSLHIISDLNRKIDLKSLYDSIYAEIKLNCGNGELALSKTLDIIYESGVFKYERR